MLQMIFRVLTILKKKMALLLVMLLDKQLMLPKILKATIPMTTILHRLSNETTLKTALII